MNQPKFLAIEVRFTQVQHLLDDFLDVKKSSFYNNMKNHFYGIAYDIKMTLHVFSLLMCSE